MYTHPTICTGMYYLYTDIIMFLVILRYTYVLYRNNDRAAGVPVRSNRDRIPFFPSHSVLLDLVTLLEEWIRSYKIYYCHKGRSRAAGGRRAGRSVPTGNLKEYRVTRSLRTRFQYEKNRYDNMKYNYWLIYVS